MSLASILAPRSVAVIGASDREASVGRAVVENLQSFEGPVYLVNSQRASVAGQKAWPSVMSIGAPVDLAVVVTPAVSVPSVVAECGQAGVGGVVVISAGFKEVGAAGAELEHRVVDEARRAGVRVIGPNCLGIMVPATGLNATFAKMASRPGRVAFLSQSGALATAILDLGVREEMGFSAFVSVGSMADVGWGDLIRYFGDDPRTESIVMYMESVGDGEGFLEAARAVAVRKPMVVIKVGRTAAAAKAAASHTGAMTGSDAVLDAALRQAGVLRVDTIEELFDLAEILAKQPLPHGPRLGLVTNAGGPGALAVDALVGCGGEVAELSPVTRSFLDAVLPASWSHGNPVDVLGDATAARLAQAVRSVGSDDAVDGVLVIVTPQAMTDLTGMADAVVAATAGLDKPVLCSWMGGASVEEARRRLNAAGLSTHDYPDAAARAFVHMWERRLRLDWLEETNRALCERRSPGSLASTPPDGVRHTLHAVAAAGRRWLTEVEAKSLLETAGLPMVATFSATTEAEAVAHAEAIGFPVVVKLQSLTITHKSDVGGVRLNVASADAVRASWRELEAAIPAGDFAGVSVQRMVPPHGWELILGAVTDPQFGRVLLIGAGGTLAEIMRDRALALPPLTPEIARRWIAQTRIAHALHGSRGRPPADVDALVDFLVRFERLVSAVPEIEEIDINPVLVSASGVLGLDARILVRSSAVA